MYRSIAARNRRARRERRQKVVGVLSVVIGGILGIVIAGLIVMATMPDHSALEKLGL